MTKRKYTKGQTTINKTHI